MGIIIDKEFQNLIPPLSSDEFKQLESNCINDGIRDPLVVWHQEDGSDILIDGHNRFKIASSKGLKFNTKTVEFPSRSDAELWIIRNQLGRRNLSKYDRSILALRLKPVISEMAKERQGERTDILPKSAISKPIDTRKEIAKIAGVSGDTISKVETIEKSGNEGVKKAVKSGEISINQGYCYVKGRNSKSPEKSKKEFLEKVKQEREDFQQAKNDGIVSVAEIKADKENAKILAKQTWNRLMKMGKGIDDIYFDMKEGSVNLEEIKKSLPSEMMRSLKENLEILQKRMNKIISEVFE